MKKILFIVLFTSFAICHSNAQQSTQSINVCGVSLANNVDSFLQKMEAKGWTTDSPTCKGSFAGIEGCLFYLNPYSKGVKYIHNIEVQIPDSEGMFANMETSRRLRMFKEIYSSKYGQPTVINKSNKSRYEWIIGRNQGRVVVATDNVKHITIDYYDNSNIKKHYTDLGFYNDL